MSPELHGIFLTRASWHPHHRGRAALPRSPILAAGQRSEAGGLAQPELRYARPGESFGGAAAQSYHGPGAKMPPVSASFQRGKAFTLLEMMVSVTILVVIIFSLYKMFDQTQRAFRGGVKIVDVMEGGRAATEFIARDLQLASGSKISGYTNVFVQTNFFATNSLFLTNDVDGTVFDLVLQQVFLVAPEGRDWKGLGFFVKETTTNLVDLALLEAGVGTLYHFTLPTNALVGKELLTNFNYAATTLSTNVIIAQRARILDGVVGFRVRALDAAGNLLVNLVPSEPLASFRGTGNDLPAYFEVELAVLSAEFIEPIKARIAPLITLPFNYAAAVPPAKLLLSRLAPQILVYRQMIAVPGAQP